MLLNSSKLSISTECWNLGCRHQMVQYLAQGNKDTTSGTYEERSLLITNRVSEYSSERGSTLGCQIDDTLLYIEATSKTEFTTKTGNFTGKKLVTSLAYEMRERKQPNYRVTAGDVTPICYEVSLGQQKAASSTEFPINHISFALAQADERDVHGQGAMSLEAAYILPLDGELVKVFAILTTKRLP
ncbi:hypothetical protein SDJN02_20945, partial [Cucurbita argyrosperma subsp. argyrosperma]